MRIYFPLNPTVAVLENRTARHRSVQHRKKKREKGLIVLINPTRTLTPALTPTRTGLEGRWGRFRRFWRRNYCADVFFVFWQLPDRCRDQMGQ